MSFVIGASDGSVIGASDGSFKYLNFETAMSNVLLSFRLAAVLVKVLSFRLAAVLVKASISPLSSSKRALTHQHFDPMSLLRFTSGHDMLDALKLPGDIAAAGANILSSSHNDPGPVQLFIKLLFKAGYSIQDTGAWTNFFMDLRSNLGVDATSLIDPEQKKVRVQLGPAVSSKNTIMVGGHYPPTTDALDAPRLADGSFGYNDTSFDLVNPDNDCVVEALTNLPSAAARQVLRERLGDEREDIPSRTFSAVWMDFVIYSMDTPDSKWTPKRKKKFIDDQRAACRKKLGISIEEEALLAVCLSLGHANFHRLTHREPMLMQVMSPAFEFVRSSVFFSVQRRLPHPQQSMMRNRGLGNTGTPLINEYDEILLNTCMQAHAGVFTESELAQLADLIGLTIGVYCRRKCGKSKMTAEEIEDDAKRITRRARNGHAVAAANAGGSSALARNGHAVAAANAGGSSALGKKLAVDKKEKRKKTGRRVRPTFVATCTTCGLESHSTGTGPIRCLECGSKNSAPAQKGLRKANNLKEAIKAIMTPRGVVRVFNWEWKRVNEIPNGMPVVVNAGSAGTK